MLQHLCGLQLQQGATIVLIRGFTGRPTGGCEIGSEIGASWVENEACLARFSPGGVAKRAVFLQYFGPQFRLKVGSGVAIFVASLRSGCGALAFVRAAAATHPDKRGADECANEDGWPTAMKGQFEYAHSDVMTWDAATANNRACAYRAGAHRRRLPVPLSDSTFF